MKTQLKDNDYRASMEQIRILEHLINYRFYKANIEALQHSIDIYRMQIDGQKGIDYSASTRKTNATTSLVENAVIKLTEKENDLEKQKVLVQAIDRAVEELEDIDKQIIKLKYMDSGSYDVSWDGVAMEVGLDRSNCFRRRDKALEKVAIVLSGVV